MKFDFLRLKFIYGLNKMNLMIPQPDSHHSGNTCFRRRILDNKSKLEPILL